MPSKYFLMQWLFQTVKERRNNNNKKTPLHLILLLLILGEITSCLAELHLLFWKFSSEKCRSKL